MTDDLKSTGAIFGAFRKLRRDNRQDNAQLRGMLNLFESDIRQDVQCVHDAADRILHILIDQREADRAADRQTDKWGKRFVAGLAGAFVFAGAAAAYDIWQHRSTAQEITAAVNALHPYLADDATQDIQAVNGLPASLKCAQSANGAGGVDIRFSASRMPEPGSPNGTETRMTGVLTAEGKLIWKTTAMDVTADKKSSDALPLSDTDVRPVAIFCKRALANVPGAAG